jgi:hypothetical protein
LSVLKDCHSQHYPFTSRKIPYTSRSIPITCPKMYGPLLKAFCPPRSTHLQVRSYSSVVKILMQTFTTGRGPIIAIFSCFFFRLFLCSPIHPFKRLIILNVTNQLTLDGVANKSCNPGLVLVYHHIYLHPLHLPHLQDHRRIPLEILQYTVVECGNNSRNMHSLLRRKLT